MLGIFLDQETTGLDSYKHRLLEVAFQVVDLEDGRLLLSYSSIVNQPDLVWEEKDPGAIAVNGFTKEMVCTGKSEKEIGKEIIELFGRLTIRRGKAVFICQNPSFDRAFFSHLVDCYTQEKLNWPYHWLDLASMYWAIEIKRSCELEQPLPEEIWLSKDYIAESILLPHEPKPHRAMQGVQHLMLCYKNIVGFPGLLV